MRRDNVNSSICKADNAGASVSLKGKKNSLAEKKSVEICRIHTRSQASKYLKMLQGLN